MVPMRTVIVEDHHITRDVMQKVCVQRFGCVLIGEAADGAHAIEVILQLKPDLVLLDMHLPLISGFSVIETIRHAGLSPRILLLSAYCDDYTVYRIERMRVNGFVDKRTGTLVELTEALAAVVAGRTYFSRTFLETRARRRKDPHGFEIVLTEREQTVLAMIGDLHPDSEIARRLGITPETLEKHRCNLRRKLGLGGGSELARYAREHGFSEGVVFLPTGTNGSRPA
jgi:DNA-binding NarL/FixJ family response regulator